MEMCLVWILLVILSVTSGTDLPCAARDGAAGQSKVCVCNSTYCDTIEKPAQLSSDQFHYYKTSNSSPGFTHTVLDFTQGLTLTNDSVVFKINASETFQEHLGIGGSFTDTMAYLYSGLSEETREKLLESYFGVTGIEYSLARLPIGNTDFSQSLYTLDDFPFDNDLSHFGLTEEDLKYKIPMVKKAVSLAQRTVKLFACTWSAPYWMKVNQTKLIGYIAQNYSDIWADYHIRSLQAFEDAGLDIWSISAGNEPFLLYLLPLSFGTLNSTLCTADSQAQWLKSHLKPKLQASNFSHVKFIGLDDQSIFLPYWMNAFRVDPEALAALDGIGLHWYVEWFMPETYMVNLYNSFHETYPDKMLIYTEGSINGGFGDDPVLLGSWYRASGYIYKIFLMLDNWNLGFIDWNMFLDPDGGPTTSFGIECPVIVNTTSDEFYKQPIYYGIGHFSKFIQPGSVKVNVESNQDVTKPRVVNLERDVDNLRSILTKARFGTPSTDVPTVNIPAEIRCLASANPDDSFSVIVINTKNITVPVRIEDPRVGSIVMDIEENSINSFVYWP